MRLPPKAVTASPVAIPAGTILHRNHHVDYPGARFNPCKGEPTRFAPLHDDESCIPTLYAATSFDGAAYETIFRGRPHPLKMIPRGAIEERGASELAPLRELKLVPLFTPELAAWGIDHAELFSPDTLIHPFCRSLATKIWRDNRTADGIVWSSVRDSSARAMLLFGGRLSEADFIIARLREVRKDPDLLTDIRSAGRRAGFRISR